MSILFWIIGSTILISLISLIGVIALALKEKYLDRVVMLLVALSAGALIGGAFLHLIPEALEEFGPEHIFIYSIIGFTSFYVIEKVFHWRHCHKGRCPEHTFAEMNLFGDAVHNIIDGIVIAASFIVSIPLGITTTFAIALHEIPQGIGNYGVLLYAKFHKWKALLLNFLVSLTVVIGGIASYFLSGLSNSTMFLIPFAAGGFVYVAASDLLPEVRKEQDLKKSLLNMLAFIVGILIIYML
ncbi:MAG: ZIP family metal transporter [Nanoarchaeota archaeon]|nr:ZIP family metal transporter [Nanoarchaeota archaeon]